ELGFRSQVHGAPTLEPEGAIDRRAMRFLGGGAAWNHVAMEQAIRDAGLSHNEVSNERTGIIMGSGGPSTRAIVEAADVTRSKGPKRVGPFAVPKAMSSTATASLSALAPVCLCWRSWSMPEPAGRAFMARLPAMGRPRTGRTWWRRAARAPLAACGWRSPV